MPSSRAKPNRLTQAYRQAPWRLQTQRGVLILMIAILSASVLWVMLNVTVQASAAGLEIQQMEADRDELERQIADLRTQYAVLTSATRMSERASEMGFEQVTQTEMSYVVVPGYTGRQPNIQAPPPRAKEPRTMLKPGYTQSLWEWLWQGLINISEQSAGGGIP